MMDRSSDIDRADPVAKAESMRGEGPDGPSPNHKERWTEERKRQASERMKARHADGTAPRGRGTPKKTAPAPEAITEDEEKMVGLMIGSLWNLGGPMVKLAKLDKQDEHTLGRAAAPVIRKYMPMLGDWSLEITLLMVTAVMVTSKRAQWKAEHPDQETVPDLDLGTFGSVVPA